MKTFNRIISLVLALLAICVTMASCSADEKKDYILVVPTETIKSNILKIKKTTSTLDTIDKVTLFDNFGIAETDYSDFMYLVPTDGNPTAETVAFFVCSDSTETPAKIKKLLEDELHRVRVSNENYNDDNFEMAKKGVVVAKGKFVYMIISPNVDAIQKSLNESIVAK